MEDKEVPTSEMGVFYMSEPKINRRDFIKNITFAGAAIASGLTLFGCGDKEKLSPEEENERTIVKGLVAEAVAAAGGMEKFVTKNNIVVVKPNIGWNRAKIQAANTNPYVVEAVVELCLNAGAKEVKVFDNPCNLAKMTYEKSGINAAVKRAGGNIYEMDDRKFKDIEIPEGEILKSWQMYTEALEADVLINVPIAKDHSMARLTMAMKNLMGLLGGNRGEIHTEFDQKLVDINTVIKPSLTIMDAYRILTAHGPDGGVPEKDVKLTKQIIVGTDPVAVDSYGATLFGLTGEDLAYVKIAHERGLGEMDTSEVIVKTGA